MKSNYTTHLIAFITFVILSYAYFSPVLEGKKLEMSDVVQYKGMAKEIKDYRAATGKEALWTNNMFSGMPAFLISVEQTNNLFDKIYNFSIKGEFPANLLLISLIGFYIALLIFGVDAWFAFAGAIAFAFTSYFFIISGAGHATKAAAIALMAPVVAGMYMTYRKKLFAGLAITGFFLAIQVRVNHPQIIFYTMFILIFFGLFELYQTIINRSWTRFIKATGGLLIIACLAIASSITSLWSVYDYSKFSTRGGSELSDSTGNTTSSGLSKDYITDWSYGIGETFTLLIPSFKGSSSHALVSKDSKSYKLLSQSYSPQQAEQYRKAMPMYFGALPFTSGPVYLGASVLFLFLLGLFIVRGRIKWWLLSITLFSIFLAWGRNMMFLTDIFIDYFPYYNKFRTVAMILVIANFAVPLLAIVSLNTIIRKEVDKIKFMKALKYSFITLGGLSLLFAIIPGIAGDFSSSADANYPQQLLDAILADRKSMLQSDALRSFIMIAIAAGLSWALFSNKIKSRTAALLFALLFLIDLWPVAKRFLNNDQFITKRNYENPFTPSQADEYILQDKDPNFRVLNVTVNTFNDASTSYYHKSIGGYHAAKMRRYQDLIERQISKNNISVFNMLNTKYFIVPGQDKQPVPQRNPSALGNAWFVYNYKTVTGADAEIDALTNFNPAEEAIVEEHFVNSLKGKTFTKDSLASIVLTEYAPGKLAYNSKCTSEQLAVFSEIYYQPGWNAFIDGKASEHIRVNYVLRAMLIPAGEHKIEFRFEPQSYYTGRKIALASSLLLLIFCAGVAAYEYKSSKYKKS